VTKNVDFEAIILIIWWSKYKRTKKNPSQTFTRITI